MAKLLNTIIDGFISSKNFISGALGCGWKIWNSNGKSKAEFDDLVIRNTMTVFELLISKIRSLKGALGITQGSGKVKSVRWDDTNFYLEIEDEMSFVANDIVRCMEFSGNLRSYWVIVSAVTGNEITVLKSEFAGVVPLAGDELVQFGNTTDKRRQSAIYLHADENGQPAIDVLFGINSKTFDGRTKIRIGGDIPGAEGLKGFYSENGMLKGVDEAGELMYCLYPDGTAYLGAGSALFRPDRSGHIAGGAISWQWDAAKDKYVCTMGDVVLQWDNLSQEVQENLKGEPGQDGLNGQDGAPGRDGIDGTDGVNGADGVSLVYKGEFATHPDSPENGWYYRNRTDKKCYVYQDNAWYVMTVDGSDGKNGLDGVNGKDGNDGLAIVWKGDSSTPPANPQKNWVYRDTDNGRVYIYNGMAWELMVADGNDGVDGTDGAPGADGTDGMSVYITYHDSESEPVKPMGDGTTGGWHTDATNAVVWMSQKVSDSASTGEWGNPVKIKGDTGKPGMDANLLPWLEDWDSNKTQIGNDYLVSPKIFSGINVGTADNPALTGVALGRGVITVNENGVEKQKSGIFGLKDGKITFSIDAETGEAMYRGQLNVNNNFTVDAGGKMTAKGASITGDFETINQANKIVISSEMNNMQLFQDGALVGSLGFGVYSNYNLPSIELYGVGLNSTLEITPLGIVLHNTAGGSDLFSLNALGFYCGNGIDVKGPARLDGGAFFISKSISEGMTLTSDNFIVLCKNTSSITVYLPSHPDPGQTIYIRRCGAGVEIHGNGAPIYRGSDGNNSRPLTNTGHAALLMWDEDRWYFNYLDI